MICVSRTPCTQIMFSRRREGANSAIIAFSSGAIATMIYSGYAHFNSDIWIDYVSKLGIDKAKGTYGAARQTLTQIASENEADLKSLRSYGGGAACWMPWF